MHFATPEYVTGITGKIIQARKFKTVRHFEDWRQCKSYSGVGSGVCLPTGLIPPPPRPQFREVPFSCLCVFFVQGGDPLTLCLLFVAKLSTFYNKSTHINNHVFIKKPKHKYLSPIKSKQTKNLIPHLEDRALSFWQVLLEPGRYH